jgi:hypothetical protein
MSQTRAVRLPAGLKIGLAALGALLAWFFLLDFSKAPLAPQLESSWIAAITFGAAEKLQFGRDIIYTYGPLGHLAFSSYSPRLFTADLIIECCLKGFYVALICLFSLRLRPARRACFLVAAVAFAIISFQTMYVFSIVCLGWILITPGRSNDLLLLPALLFAAIAALIKLTFLWFALLVLTCAAVVCLIQRRFLRAAGALALFAAAFCSAWFLSGQEWGTLPAFLQRAREVTVGYSKTMGLACAASILTAGVTVGLLFLTQLDLLLSRNARRFSAWAMGFMLCAGLFLAWKLGFSRADWHTMEFFYYASLTALALPAFFDRKLSGVPGTSNWVLALVIVAFSAWAVISQDRNIGGRFASILRSRSEVNLNTLLHPSTAEGWRASDLQNAEKFALPRIRETVGRARVDVFGFEQAIALLNGLNYTPSPNVQTYCDYTPFLAELAARFYRSDRAPDYVIFKLQRLDNRLATLNHAEVLVRLGQDYEPLFLESDYLLLKRQKTSRGPLAAELVRLGEGMTTMGENIPVPEGVIWCELQLRETLLGKILAFLYHPPEVQLEVRIANGATTVRRFLPTLGSNGFLINPFLNSEEDFIAWTAAQQEPLSTTQTIRIVPDPVLNWFYEPKMTYRLSQVPMPSSPSPAGAALFRHLRSFADIFSTPASLVKSDFPPQRFSMEGKSFVLVHPEGEVRFDVPAGATAASGEFGFHPQAYLGGATDGVEFQVEFAPSGASASPTTLFRRTLTPLPVVADRGIQRFRVELPLGEEGQLVLRTRQGPEGHLDWDWAGWSSIQFEPKP